MPGIVPTNMTPASAAAELHAAIDHGLEIFQHIDATRTAERPRPDAWCAREILGHLIDSACNNHRRFILGQSPETRAFDGYEQNAWVARQRYHEVPWQDLVTLWSAYNRHLAHVMSCIPGEVFARSAASPDGSGQITVGFLVEDYIRHMRHHLARISSMLVSH